MEDKGESKGKGLEHIVYKYYPMLEYTKDALTNGYFFFNKSTYQNDPFDCSFRLLQSEILLRRLGYTKESEDSARKIMGEYGGCCFTTRKDNKRLWSFYSHNYKGIVIGFDERRFSEYLQQGIHYIKVEYKDTPITDECLDDTFQLEMPILKADLEKEEDTSHYLLDEYTYRNSLRDERTRDALFFRLCSLKERTVWADEEEYRLIAAGSVQREENKERQRNEGVEYDDTGYKIPIPSDCIKEIIIGHNFDMKEIGWVKQLAEKYGVKIIQQTKAEKPFEIEFVDITEKLNHSKTVDAGVKGYVEEEDNLGLEESKLSDFIDFQQRMRYRLYRTLGWIVCIIAIASIGVLQLTDWRPLGEAVRYEEINEVILNLSYSYLAAYIFYIVVNWLPSLKRKSIIKSYIKYHISKIREQISICTNSQYRYAYFGQEKKPYIGCKPYKSREVFVREFGEKELHGLGLLESSRTQIKMLVGSALFFQEYLSEKELDNLLKIKESLFIKESIRPIEYIDDEQRTEIPNNQREMAKSIYDIYELIKAIEK